MRYRPHSTKNYGVRKLAIARVRNFYAYENFCDYTVAKRELNSVPGQSDRRSVSVAVKHRRRIGEVKGELGKGREKIGLMRHIKKKKKTNKKARP